MTSNRLRVVAVVLAVLSLVAALGAGLAAAFVMGGDDDSSDEPTPSGSANPGWSTVSGIPGSAGPATYQVPGGADWEIHDADFAVSYKDDDGTPDASGHAASFYYGNDCTDGEETVAAGWALLADAQRGPDLDALAARSVRAWARGYGTGAGGTKAPTDQLVVGDFLLGDGTPAVSARISLDMSVFEGPCLSGAAEVTVVSFPTRDGIKSLVAARYLGVEGGISDEVYDAILKSVRPD